MILGDGYTAADMPKFRADVDKHMNVLFTIEPYKSYRNYMNVYSVEIPSPESGVSCDPDLTSPTRNTPLHMAFWEGCDPQGVQRALVLDDSAATTYANLVPGTAASNRQILAIANSTTYGGVGGTYATASGGNAMSSLITPHELGHSLGGLQDEYDYYARGVRGDAYTDGEPDSVHHTLLTEQQMTQQQKKWWRWLGEPSESGGTIGRYESGMYSGTGVWRPSAHSIMKTLGYHYDQVGREDMVKSISAKTSIVQDSTPTTKTIGADRAVWVAPMHPNSHQLTITWSVDGKALAANGQQLDLRQLNLKAGKHKVTATVVDPTDFVRDPAPPGADRHPQLERRHRGENAADDPGIWTSRPPAAARRGRGRLRRNGRADRLDPFGVLAPRRPAGRERPGLRAARGIRRAHPHGDHRRHDPDLDGGRVRPDDDRRAAARARVPRFVHDAPDTVRRTAGVPRGRRRLVQVLRLADGPGRAVPVHPDGHGDRRPGVRQPRPGRADGVAVRPAHPGLRPPPHRIPLHRRGGQRGPDSPRR